MSRLNDLGPGVDKLENLIGSDSGKPSKGPRLDNRRLILFAMLYAVQGVVISYFITYNGRYMRASGFTDPSRPEGLSITQVGWSQTIATLPLAIKFLFGLWADRHNFLNFGHRKPYIILGLILQGISLFGISMINPVRHLSAFTLVATMAVAGLCLYDVACDAFAVQVTPKTTDRVFRAFFRPLGLSRPPSVVWFSDSSGRLRRFPVRAYFGYAEFSLYRPSFTRFGSLSRNIVEMVKASAGARSISFARKASGPFSSSASFMLWSALG